MKVGENFWSFLVGYICGLTIAEVIIAIFLI